MSRKRAITTFLSQKSMITRLSIAFEDFLGSSIAPQVVPPWYSHLHLRVHTEKILHILLDYESLYIYEFCKTHKFSFEYYWEEYFINIVNYTKYFCKCFQYTNKFWEMSRSWFRKSYWTFNRAWIERLLELPGFPISNARALQFHNTLHYILGSRGPHGIPSF